MNYLYGAVTAGAAMAVDYVKDHAPAVIVDYVRPPKVVQKRDPIATLCMLTIRNFSPYDKAKPAMNGHFYWTKRQTRIVESYTRGRQRVDHDDFVFLEEPILELIAYWRPTKSSTLVKIAQEARSALKKVSSAYEGKTNCVKTTAELYGLKLKDWIDSLETPQKQPAEEPDFIKKVKGLWTDANIELFHAHYSSQSLPQAESFLEVQRIAYFKAIEPDGRTPFLEK